MGIINAVIADTRLRLKTKNNPNTAVVYVGRLKIFAQYMGGKINALLKCKLGQG